MSDKKQPKMFEVGRVAIDEDGVWWFIYVGQHPDQGGISYRWGSIGLADPISLGNAVGGAMKMEEDEYKRRIKEKTVPTPES